MSNDDLWGDLDTSAPTELHPRRILLDQISAIHERTKGVISGQLKTDDNPGGSWDVQLTFDLVCPALRNYTFRVLRILYRIPHLYPFKLHWTADDGGPQVADVENLDYFKERTKLILQSARVRNAILALMREARS